MLVTLEKLAGNASLLECMTAACVPSTLVKCLYIFLDLPAVAAGEDSRDRTQLQLKFTQVC